MAVSNAELPISNSPDDSEEEESTPLLSGAAHSNAAPQVIIVPPDTPQVRDTQPHLSTCGGCLISRLLGYNTIPNAVGEPKIFTVYKWRFVQLMTFGLFNMTQGYLNNVFAVTAISMSAAYSWSETSLDLLMVWLYVGYICSAFPIFAYTEKNFRGAVVLSSLAMFIAGGLRVSCSYSPCVTWVSHVGQALIGIAGPIAFTGGANISAKWFPPSGRAKATAVGTMMGFAGAASAFLIGPYSIRQPVTQYGVTCPHTTLLTMLYSEPACDLNDEIINIDAIRDDVKALRLYELFATMLSFCLLYATFLSQPPTPPCASAIKPVMPFTSGLHGVFRNYPVVLLVAIPGGLVAGVYGIWSPLLDVVLKNVGADQRVSGYIGFTASLSGCFVGFFAGIIADKRQAWMKPMIILMLAISAASMVVVALMASGMITCHLVSLAACIVIIGMCINGSVPLFYELCIERTYPLPENAITSVITILYNIFPIIFLGISQVPHIGTNWMNWFLLGCIGVSMLMIAVYRPVFSRSSVDAAQQSDNAAINAVDEDQQHLNANGVDVGGDEPHV